MKKHRVFCALISFALLICMVPTGVFAVAEDVQENDMQLANACSGLDAAVAYLGDQELIDNVSAAFLYEFNTNTLMYAKNPDVQIYPSSLVKVLTALLAVEEGNPEDIVTVREDVLSTVAYDAISVDLQAGEQISLNDLLYCMMVGSGNDAAAVIADHIGGNQAAFVEKMNSYAQNLGCRNTQFMNAHGLHDDAQYTTARDMARIITAAIDNERFLTYFSTAHYTVPATNKSEERSLSSRNFLINNDGMEIYYDERVTGGRTGIANDGTSCLAATAESNDMELVCVLAGAESTFAENGDTVVYGGFKEASALFTAGLDGYKAAQVLFDGQTVRQVSVINGTSDVVLGSRSTVSAILPEDVSQENLQYQYVNYYDGLTAPVDIGDKLANVQIWYGSICIAQADLYAMNSVQSTLTQQAATDGNGGGTVLKIFFVIVLSLLLGAAFCLLLLRLFNKILHLKTKQRGKRYRRDRRRSR